MKRSTKVVLAIGLLGIGGLVAMALYNDRTFLESDDDYHRGKQRPDTPEGRRGFAEILRHDMRASADEVYTEGGLSQGLVFDMRDCTHRRLSELVQRSEIGARLWQFDFSYVRCTNGVRVEGPWEH